MTTGPVRFESTSHELSTVHDPPSSFGAGRYAAYLAARGHSVVGVDSSPDMLARARARVADATFVPGDMHRLPLANSSVDIVVSALALVTCRCWPRCWPNSLGCCAPADTS